MSWRSRSTSITRPSSVIRTERTLCCEIRETEREASWPPPNCIVASATSSLASMLRGSKKPKWPDEALGVSPKRRSTRSMSWMSRSEATPVRIRSEYGECRTVVLAAGIACGDGGLGVDPATDGP